MSCCSDYHEIDNRIPNNSQIKACIKALRDFALHPPKTGELCVKRTKYNGKQYDTMISLLNSRNSHLLNAIANMIVKNHLMNIQPVSISHTGMPFYIYSGGDCGGAGCGQGHNPVIADVIFNMLNLELNIYKRSIQNVVERLKININYDQVRQLYPECFDINENPLIC